MKKKNLVSASILCADLAHLSAEIKKCEDAGVDMFHVDVMDGHFVPPITVGRVIVEAMRPLTKLPIEAHLMVDHPETQIDDFIDAGVDSVSVHAECYGQLRDHCNGLGKFPKEVVSIDADKALRDIRQIQRKGKKAFMALNPGTPLCVDAVLGALDGLLVMSVNPGFAGQKFMPEVLPKLQALRTKYDGDLAIDGGINDATAPLAVAAGANILATASYLFRAKDMKKNVDYLKGL